MTIEYLLRHQKMMLLQDHIVYLWFKLKVKKFGENKRTLSKLHIVDLSCSERPFQTGVNGQRLNEALNINMSLFYLNK